MNSTYLALINDGLVFGANLDESAAHICQVCTNALSAKCASVWLLDKEQSSLELLAQHSQGTTELGEQPLIEREHCESFFSALSVERVFAHTTSAAEQQSLNTAPDAVQRLFGEQTNLCASLRYQGTFRGVICITASADRCDWIEDEKTFLSSVSDMFSQRLMHEQMIRNEAQHKALFEATTEGIMVFGNGLFIDVNPATCEMFGVTRKQIIGKTPSEFSPEFQPDGRASSEKSMQYIMACLQGTPQIFEWRHQKFNGDLFDAEVTLNAVRYEGEDTLFASVHDISDRKEAERKEQRIQEEIEFRATHDSLTGLMNREMLHTSVDEMISCLAHSSRPVNIALLLFDLNRFKEVNDTLGHATGDKVLIQLARGLTKKVIDTGGQLYRLGGDEFVAVYNSLTCTIKFDEIDQFLAQCLKQPIQVDDINMEMGASIGIALYPKDGADSHELLRCADVAMYHAKETEGASAWYNTENDVNNKRRLAMMVELRTAIRENQLTLHYQPRIHIKTGEVTGCEALVRWQHPTLGMVPPNNFIPLAEMSDLIHPLSAWVLESAFSQMTKLKNQGLQIPIAINISARNLTNSKLIDTIESLVKKEPDAAQFLELEITESALINHPQIALDNLNKLEKLGLSIAIDDYGTGYSSLNYLKKLPVNTLKIDQSFVKDMLVDSSDSMIIDSTIHLAHNFAMTVVAEGVEDQETLDALEANNCDQAQGFHIARPMPAEDLELWLHKQATVDYQQKRAS